MRLSFRIVTFALAITLLPVLSRNVFSQYGYPGMSGEGISAMATEKVELKPERIRLVMWVKAQGSDAKSSIVALTAHKERVRKELEGMSADKNSIIFSAPRLSNSSNDPNAARRRSMQMQMQMQMRGGRGAAAAPPEPPAVFTAMCAVKAEWPLPVQEGDALALLPETLKEKIASRDLAGEKNKPKLTAEEEEQLEEMEAMMQEEYSYYDDGSSGIGPSISFIATVSDEAVKKATESAFKKAVADADRISAATGVVKGKMISLSTTLSSADEYREMFQPRYGNPQSLPSSFTTDSGNVVSASVPDELKQGVMVAVTYAIE